jgi:hypothetical protein
MNFPYTAPFSVPPPPPLHTHTPGTQLRYSLCRWGALGFPRFFMSEPALAVEHNSRNSSSRGHSDDGSSSGSSSSVSSSSLGSNSRRYGLRVEGTLPAAAAAKAAVIWQGLGLQDLNAAAAGANSEGGYCMEAAGTVSTTLEFLLVPLTFKKALHDLFWLLPHSLWAVGPGRVWSTLSGYFGVRKREKV